MSNSERTPGAKPLFYYKVGLLGSLPPEVSPDLAYELEGSVCLSLDSLRKQYRSAHSLSTSTQARVLLRIFKEKAAALLPRVDVVGDILFNTPKTRGVGQRLAHAAGGLTVALNVHTPFDIAEARVAQSVPDENIDLTTAQWRQNQLGVLRVMTTSLKFARTGEGIDHVLDIDGSPDDYTVIVAEICDQLTERGLLEAE